ncbi:hypothetical protein Nepgr_012634 [Nepenthes gracilis]|uniref:Calcineurin-binding protein 1 n=1 Tax=Nepenthes gracilis TaxID=150966 RepID=A0AAD3SGC2_NEPGR|nr:hypothetical protein Nepgr_012634 [Nepenthes gracilis]
MIPEPSDVRQSDPVEPTSALTQFRSKPTSPLSFIAIITELPQEDSDSYKEHRHQGRSHRENAARKHQSYNQEIGKMFSIVAINDTESRGQWEPLAPTKEAQEFHVTQTYHEGLLKLQAKEYDKARELLENVLKDPLISGAQVDNTAGDGHLLQLRFLALKNLATVFLQQGSAHYESALHCYLQAVEIDTKDSVVWNQLGTLSCSMGLLSTSRWAFEQGLLCSPNNWNCMEKLLEVLIAIGDEVACLSVAELILRHWPSHSRALHVKRTIEELEPIPFSPRGIDKLEPKHARLKFVEKRKATIDYANEDFALKRLNQNIELFLEEASWEALADAILQILSHSSRFSPDQVEVRSNGSANIRVAIRLPPSSVDGASSLETKGSTESISIGDCYARNDNAIGKKETSEEQSHERRSSRLERLRSHKPGKEESEFSSSKDVAKIVMQFLEPFIIRGQQAKDFDNASASQTCPDGMTNSVDNECSSLADFVKETSKNFGAYHFGHLLLEKVARGGLLYRDALVKFLELEKLTRHWGCDRSPDCNLFLAELYYDLGSCSDDVSRLSEFMYNASYHLCKIIESVSLDYPLNWSGTSAGKSCSPTVYSSQDTNKMPSDFAVWQKSHLDGSILSDKTSFWVRFFWLSGHVSVWEGNREKAHEEFCISLLLLENNKDLNDVPGAISLPYCKVTKKLTIDRILHEINLLEVYLLMKKTVDEMIEKEMYSECINLLAPLLFHTKDVHQDILPATDSGEGVASVELSALDVLIKSCEKVKPLDMEVYLNCHRRKLQILILAAGMEDFVTSCKHFNEKIGPKVNLTSDAESKDSANKHLLDLVVGEVKAISQCASQVKNWIDQRGDSNGISVPTSIISHIQSLLLAFMGNIARMYFCKKPLGTAGLDQVEQKQKSCFVNAAIAFCKLQHLDLTVSIKTQVNLIVAIHDLLAEYGFCCVDEDGEGVDGTFLKLAIKHLLALDMKLKSNFHSLDKGTEITVSHGQISDIDAVKESSDVLNMEVDQTTIVSTNPMDNVATLGISSYSDLNEDVVACRNCDGLLDGEKASGLSVKYDTEVAEDEREELEMAIDNALDQCLFCLYGLNLRSDSSYEDDVVVHKNTSRADYQSKEQCADVFKYILPYAKASTRTGLLKLRRVLRAIRKHFPQPPEDVLAENSINKFLDDPNMCEDKLWEDTGSDGFPEAMIKIMFPDMGVLKQNKSCEPYLEVYSNLYYLLAQSEETSATDKWPGFVLTKEGEEFVEQSANLFKYDLLFNPLRFESWQRLATIYDEEVDLLLNDGSKHINVAGWRKNVSLPQRVETSRRRSRRCLLMSLALAKTSDQQAEIHELLALVYYDGLQNVVPFYDQRTLAPSKDAVWLIFCQNSMKHFEKAFAQKKDWSHAFYLGKLCEKLGYSPELSFSYYHKAITLNPSAVDPMYRLHASRLKLLSAWQRQNIEALKVSAAYSFNESTKATVMNIIGKMCPEKQQLLVDEMDKTVQDNLEEEKNEESCQLDNARDMLYDDCLSALEICVEGDLKHFHKARYMLAQGLYRRGKSGDTEKAKEELSFCFKSSRSSYTINMWEIDGMVKKGRRKTPGVSGNKKVLEVNLPESSRKFISCIRKYLLFYLKLLEETGDICTLERAYVSIRADKRFSLCLEDLVPVALGRYLKALISSIRSDVDIASSIASSSQDQILEKMFTLFLEQGSLWADICSLPEIKTSELSENSLYGHLHQHIYSLERNSKLEVIEGINEKIRKRFKNPKLSNSNCATVCRHASIAWCRSLIINLALISPFQSNASGEIQVANPSDGDLENNQLLCVDLQTSDFWNPSFGNSTHLVNLEAKWHPFLSRINNVIMKKATEENMENANSILRSAYSFYRDCSSVVLTSGVSLFWVPARLATNPQFQPGVDGVEMVDVSMPRKLLLWAYTLLHGRCTNISTVIKFCEENVKSKLKKGAGSSSTPLSPARTVAGGCKDGAGHGEAGIVPSTTPASSSLPECNTTHGPNLAPCSGETRMILSSSPQLHQCNNTAAERSERISFDLNDDVGNFDKS